MRQPQLFKMACLRDIRRLFGEEGEDVFFAGFGNRLTDAMSYRSVGVKASKVFTIDSNGVVVTELLHSSGHKASYIQMVCLPASGTAHLITQGDSVDGLFPLVTAKNNTEYSDFNFWRSSIPDVQLPDLSPPSPALSARSDTSSRLSVLGKITGIGRRPSKQPLLPITDPNRDPISRPSSPLVGPSMTPDDLDTQDQSHSRSSSMPGSFDEKGQYFPSHMSRSNAEEQAMEEGRKLGDDAFDDEAIFDDDILATGEMRNVPF